MKLLVDFLRLVRFPNLVVIALTQYAIRFGIIYPFLQQAELDLYLSEKTFGALVLATVLIAAAGYIINDYFDIKLDYLNKPKQMIVGKRIKRRWAMVLHILFNAIGLFLAAYVALSIEHPWLILFQLISAALLWFYSVNFKKQVFIGNLIIAAQHEQLILKVVAQLFFKIHFLGKNHLTHIQFLQFASHCGVFCCCCCRIGSPLFDCFI